MSATGKRERILEKVTFFSIRVTFFNRKHTDCHALFSDNPAETDHVESAMKDKWDALFSALEGEGKGEVQAPLPVPDKGVSGFGIPAPGEVNALDSVGLAKLSETFRTWLRQARTPSAKGSRLRICLVYLLLRYSGARLGEVLALDERTDIDFRNGTVRFGSESAGRAVQIPEHVVSEIETLLADPVLQKVRGKIFRLDQGFVRRKFYERAEECSLPKEMANPSALRRSRAIELLRSGVPLPVVQNVLGHSTAGLTASYLDFSPEEIKRITDHFLRREARRTSSARNSFFGKITGLRTGDIQSEVEVTTISGYRVVSVVTNESIERLGLCAGNLVTAEVKAPWVVLQKGGGPEPKASARNRFLGRVVRINRGSITAEVILGLEDGTTLCSTVTSESLRELNIRIGDQAWAIFKSFSVVLHAE
jgi:molybdate transport system regulatory protein